MNESDGTSDPPVVLVVDDQRDTADLYAQYLESDFEVVTAYSGKEALEKLRPEVAVVLLDRRMAGLHGDEVLDEIRKRDGDRRIVMVTAVDPSIDVVGLDFDDYLVKPVSRETLRDVVTRMLARNALDESLLDAFALGSKMATLEAKMDPEELEASEEYAKLEARFDEFRRLFEQIDPDNNLYAELAKTKMEALFEDR